MKRLIIIAGPTAVGKTAHAIRLAQQLGTEVLSCDSRQFYREMRIGVARPTDDELHTVPHHFIASRSVTEPYNIYTYLADATRVINQLMLRHDNVVVVGGSGLYIDALIHGVSTMPDPSPELRRRLQLMPLEEKQQLLAELDNEYYGRVDLRNPVRLQRALEVCLTTGRPYSQIIAEHQRRRPASEWTPELQVLSLPPDQLRRRIDQRVDRMMQEGLLDEVRSLLPYRHLPALRTVGYTELFPVVDGTAALADAVAQIKLNTWHYARKQATWFRRYPTAIQQTPFFIDNIL